LVLALLQQVLAALIVGVLIEDPPASQDPAGVNLPPVELLQHRGTVFSHLKHLAIKVPFTIQLDLVRISAGLSEDDAEQDRDLMNKCIMQTRLGRERLQWEFNKKRNRVDDIMKNESFSLIFIKGITPSLVSAFTGQYP